MKKGNVKQQKTQNKPLYGSKKNNKSHEDKENKNRRLRKAEKRHTPLTKYLWLWYNKRRVSICCAVVFAPIWTIIPE